MAWPETDWYLPDGMGLVYQNDLGEWVAPSNADECCCPQPSTTTSATTSTTSGEILCDGCTGTDYCGTNFCFVATIPVYWGGTCHDCEMEPILGNVRCCPTNPNNYWWGSWNAPCEGQSTPTKWTISLYAVGGPLPPCYYTLTLQTQTLGLSCYLYYKKLIITSGDPSESPAGTYTFVAAAPSGG